MGPGEPEGSGVGRKPEGPGVGRRPEGSGEDRAQSEYDGPGELHEPEVPGAHETIEVYDATDACASNDGATREQQLLHAWHTRATQDFHATAVATYDFHPWNKTELSYKLPRKPSSSHCAKSE